MINNLYSKNELLCANHKPQSYQIQVPTGVAVLHEFAFHSSHRAKNYFLI
jgi:hypothetical protein